MIKLDIKFGNHETSPTVPQDLLVSHLRYSIAMNLNQKYNQSIHPDTLELYVGNQKLIVEESLNSNRVKSGDTILVVEASNLQHYGIEGDYPGHLSQGTTESIGVQPFNMIPNATQHTSMMEMLPLIDGNAHPPVIPTAISEEEPRVRDPGKRKLELPKYVSFDDLLKHKKFTARMREQCKESVEIRFADVFLLGLYESTYRLRKLRKKSYILLITFSIVGFVFSYLLYVVLFEEIRDHTGLDDMISSIEIELEGLGGINVTWSSFGSSDDGVPISDQGRQASLKEEFFPWLVTESILYGRIESSIMFDSDLEVRELTVYDERAEIWQWIQLISCYEDLSIIEGLTIMCQIWDYSTFRFYDVLCHAREQEYCAVIGPAEWNVSYPHSTFCDAEDTCSGGSFHEDSIVWVEPTYPQIRPIPKMMKQVRAGDRVLSISPSGDHFFDVVWFNLHAAGPRFTRFFNLIEIEVLLPNEKAEMWLSVTLDHKLFFSEDQTKAARLFSIGDTIFTSLGPGKVARRRFLPSRPVRSLLTMQGRYVVGPVSDEENLLRQAEASFGVLCDNLIEGSASELSKLPLLTKLSMTLEPFRRLRINPRNPAVEWLIQVIVDIYVYVILTSRFGLLLFGALLPIVDIAVIGLTLCSLITLSDFAMVALLLFDSEYCLTLLQIS